MNPPIMPAIKQALQGKKPSAVSGLGNHVCRILCEANHSGFTDELGLLLRNRLRLATTLLAVTYAVLFGLTILLPTYVEDTKIGRSLMMGVTFFTTGLAVYLWKRPITELCRLRKLELVLFGLITIQFIYLNFEIYRQPLIRSAFAQLTEEAARDVLLSTISVNNVLRWFALIVIYGTFIPNTARRCAAIVCTWALMPILIGAVDTYMQGMFSVFLLRVVPYLLVFMALAVGIAIFGSHRIHLLQQQAFESKQLGQYRLKTRLGYGGMGEVFLAEHLLLKRPCVVKLIRGERANDPTTQARFEREVQATAGLTHWNTVQIFDYGHTLEGTFYYVMEYLPGLSLSEIVTESGPLEPARVVFLLKQICMALSEAHTSGLIHRDIKPSNILVCPLGGLHDVAKLLDFGLVLHPQLEHDDAKLTREGFIVGTPEYMSPEQAQGLENVDGRSDIYSLAATAYFMLTGQPPFVKATAMQTVIAHARETPKPPSSIVADVPTDLEAIIMQCLEKNPERRLSSARLVVKALDETGLADGWNEDKAADWWRTHGRGHAQDQYDTPTLVTATVT